MNDKKILGDSGEHYALSMLGFAGLPCSKLPDNWKYYDLIVQRNNVLERISVKTRSESASFGKSSWFSFETTGNYEWVIFIVKFHNREVRSWAIPLDVAVQHSSARVTGSKNPDRRTISWGKLEESPLIKYFDNWLLERF